MISSIQLYFATLVPLLLLDGAWLMVVAKNFYTQKLGHMFAATPTWWPAILFYLLYPMAIVYFVSLPNLQSSLGKTAVVAACFGLIVYSAYDLTNHATLKNWPLSVTVIDMAWGGVVTALAATGGILIMRWWN